MASFYQQIVFALSEEKPFVLAVISGVTGSSPQRVGAKALFFADGKIVGTVGGGCLEAEIQSRSLAALKTGRPATFEMVLNHDFGWDDGLICGGSVSGLILPMTSQSADVWRTLAGTQSPLSWGVKPDFTIAFGDQMTADWLYLESVSPPCALWIAGSGHVAQAVAPLALQLDFDVTIFDDRPALANHTYFPDRVRLRVAGWHELLKEPPPVRPAFGLIVTRGHQHDALVLSEWIHRPFVFLGMIGSTRKARIIYQQFLRQKIATPEQLEKIACPVGLDIGSATTPEIALSIMAQYVQQRAMSQALLKAETTR